ncbi:hypothetical protein PBV87_12825 [Niameybacter massiliensis]|uniref:Uncharacterized protein n=1 Tax=Holtiella tumoricola TaxID=3018743 RepID=A0AA42DNY3_9FIRM|nr:hypothetical protein [Holtiella tumoricola]MDA3732372.1 hypothetical protein [Holtiella tumoricola]
MHLIGYGKYIGELMSTIDFEEDIMSEIVKSDMPKGNITYNDFFIKDINDSTINKLQERLEGHEETQLKQMKIVVDDMISNENILDHIGRMLSVVALLVSVLGFVFSAYSLGINIVSNNIGKAEVLINQLDSKKEDVQQIQDTQKIEEAEEVKTMLEINKDFLRTLDIMYFGMIVIYITGIVYAIYKIYKNYQSKIVKKKLICIQIAIDNILNES